MNLGLPKRLQSIYNNLNNYAIEINKNTLISDELLLNFEKEINKSIPNKYEKLLYIFINNFFKKEPLILQDLAIRYNLQYIVLWTNIKILLINLNLKNKLYIKKIKNKYYVDRYKTKNIKQKNNTNDNINNKQNNIIDILNLETERRLNNNIKNINNSNKILDIYEQDFLIENDNIRKLINNRKKLL